MASKGTVFLDLDESLVKTKTLYFPTDKQPEGSRLVEASRGQQTWRGAVKARPSSQATLEVLAQSYDLCVLTSGHSVVQTAVVRTLGWEHFFTHIYGFDLWDTLVVPQRWVLLDDLDTSCGGLEDKFKVLGYLARDLKCPWQQRVQNQEDGTWWEGERWQAVMDRHFVHCQPWHGGADDHPLTALLEDIHVKLAAQGQCK